MSTTSPLFNNPDADVVLRSSDGVDFHVDLAMLTMASPVFRDMTTLPIPPSQGNTGGRPIIPLQTTSTTLELLLQLVHPSMHPNFEQVTDLSVYGELLKAADMYHMPKVAPAIGHVLADPQFLATEEGALYMFAMASRYGLDARARAAAKALLLYPPPHERDVEPAGFRDLPAMAYHRLLNYRRRCVGVLFSETDAPYERQWVDGWWRNNVETVYGGYLWAHCQSHYMEGYSKANSGPAPQWFCDHIERIKRAYTRKVAVESVASTELLEITIRSVTKSPRQTCTCHETAAANLMKLSTILSQKVERGLAKVSRSTIALPHRSSPLRSSIESVGKNGQKGDLPHRMTTNPGTKDHWD